MLCKIFFKIESYIHKILWHRKQKAKDKQKAAESERTQAFTIEKWYLNQIPLPMLPEQGHSQITSSWFKWKVT